MTCDCFFFFNHNNGTKLTTHKNEKFEITQSYLETIYKYIYIYTFFIYLFAMINNYYTNHEQSYPPYQT